VLYAEARLRQESMGHYEESLGNPQGFLRDTDASTRRHDLRAGFSTSPWRSLSLNAHYRYYKQDVNYDHVLDQSPLGGTGYPAFIRWRNTDTDEAEAKLTWRPCAWLKTSLIYQYETTKYQADTDAVTAPPAPPPAVTPGGRLETAHYDAQRYSVNATLTPWRRVYFSGTFSYADTRLEAFDNNSPIVVPYRGDVFSALASVTYVLNEKTDLNGSYSFSRADYRQTNFADGLPMGMHYHQHAVTAGFMRRISKNVSARLQYGFYYYDEPSSGGANDYTAHAVFATLVVRIP
jgi:hypothetical protein